MKECICCGGRLVRYWPFEECGPCKREDFTLSEEAYEEALRFCVARTDPRLRSLPFFVPLGPKRLSLAEEVEEVDAL